MKYELPLAFNTGNDQQVKIPWIVNLDNTQVLVFIYDENKKYQTSDDKPIYEILKLDEVTNIENWDVPLDNQKSQAFYKYIKNYFASGHFDFASIKNAINYNFKLKTKIDDLINVLFTNNFFDKELFSDNNIRQSILAIMQKPTLGKPISVIIENDKQIQKTWFSRVCNFFFSKENNVNVPIDANKINDIDTTSHPQSNVNKIKSQII